MTAKDYIEDLQYEAAVEAYTNGFSARLELIEWELLRIKTEKAKNGS